MGKFLIEPLLIIIIIGIGVIFICLIDPKANYPTEVKLKENKGVIFSSNIKTDLMVVKIKDKIHLNVHRENQPKLRLNISEKYIQIKVINRQNNFQTNTVDYNGDGIPERRFIFKEKKLIRTELFYQGNFIEAKYLNKKWQTEKGELIYKNGFWDLVKT